MGTCGGTTSPSFAPHRIRRIGIDRASAWFEQTALPRAREVPGFVGALDLVDRATGSGLTLTFWETADARDASEEVAARLRDEGASALEADIVGVERYEVATKAL